MVNLTSNAVSMLYNKQAPDGFEPWLQVIDVRKIKPASGGVGDRYRIVLSDGTSYISGMLATQLAPLMEKNSLMVNYLIQLKDYLNNEVQGRRIIIVLRIGEIIPANDRMGSPQNIESTSGGAAPTSSVQIPPPLSTHSNSSVTNMNNQSSTVPKQVNTYAPPSVKPTYNHAPVVRQNPNVIVSDIQSLNPYAAGRWTIKARVTNRSAVKTWANARGQGKLFSCDLLDAKGGEIRATMFNDAVDKFYDLLSPGGIYYFSGGRIKMANRKFSALKNDYEISFDQHAEISKTSDDGEIQEMVYSFKKISSIENLPAESNIDVIAIVKSIGPVNEIMSKTGKQLFKRDIILVDDSNAEIKFTLWNEKAQEDISNWVNNVIAVKGCRISEYNGRSLGANASSSFALNPAIREAGHLMNWYASGGANTQAKSLSASGGFGGSGLGSFTERAVVSDIKSKQLGYGQKADYITVKGTVSFIKHDGTISYQGCTKCQKKVVPDVAQNFVCEKCQMSYPTCENRYILSMVVLDHSGSTWTTCFNEEGKIIMNGKSADEIVELREANVTLFDTMFKEAMFKQYVMRLRVKADTVMEELRVKTSIVQLEPINFVQESKDLINAIEQFA